MGDRFLKHLMRYRVLLQIKTIEAELQECGQSLDENPRLFALNKTDAVMQDELKELVSYFEEKGIFCSQSLLLQGRALKSLLIIWVSLYILVSSNISC